MYGIDFSPELIVGMVALGFIFVFLIFLLFFLFFRRTSSRKIKKKWKKIQAKLSKKEEWCQALIEADKLLDKALKSKNYTGKTTGEKLVKAEKIFTDKDEVWYGHKLSKFARDKQNLNLKKSDMKRALLGIRKGLKDLGSM